MVAVQHVLSSPLLRHYKLDSITCASEFLDRQVKVDVYFPANTDDRRQAGLLLVNDGQDLPGMPFGPMLDNLYAHGTLQPLVVAAIHCSADRILEYGTADILDYMNRGSRARYHRKFVLRELIPLLKSAQLVQANCAIGYAGFSLGGLSALDVAWKHPDIFSSVGVFSGALWWRTRALDNGYREETDRIMHQLIRDGNFAANLRFFFQTGTLDETADRNKNGIIDSIDDTTDLIAELRKKGYTENQIRYLELKGGRHDVPTWAKAFPEFLKWGWGR